MNHSDMCAIEHPTAAEVHQCLTLLRQRQVAVIQGMVGLAQPYTIIHGPLPEDRAAAEDGAAGGE